PRPAVPRELVRGAGPPDHGSDRLGDPGSEGVTLEMWPPVSVVMPIRNEAAHLAAAVSAVLAQEYPGALEVVLAVGPSTDGTEAVAAELAVDERVSVVANPSGITPAGLNVGIQAAVGEV